MLQMKLFGTPMVVLDGQPLTFKTNKSQALLYYLAMEPGYHSRDLLADLLWPNMQTQQARKNLRDALSQLRAVAGDYLLINSQKLAFAVTRSHQSDVAEFTRQIEQGRANQDLTTVEKGLALYSAEFLVGFHLLDAHTFDSWAQQQREMFHHVVIETMEWLARQQLQRQTYEAGAETARHLLALEPWHESIHRLLMQLYALAGKRLAAIRQYELCRQQLFNEMGILPSAETELLYAQIKAGQLLPTSRPTASLAPVEAATIGLAASEPPTILHNLPRALKVLIGRDEELADLQLLLGNTAYPLITLFGEGGIGKTKLALAAAQALLQPLNMRTDQRATAAPRLSAQVPSQADEPPGVINATPMPTPPFKDGIWFVDLAAIDVTGRTPSQISEVIAGAIGETIHFTFSGRESFSDQLRLYLHNKAMLLLLDNFEKFYLGALFLVDLLEAAPALQLLVTSRRRLALSAEHLVKVTGLALPPVSAQQPTLPPLTAAQLLDYHAIRLFYVCAQRIQPNFRLTETNIGAVVEICQLLSGSPLGIELAATQLSRYECHTIAARIIDDEQMLTTHSADLPARQRSMRAVLDMTWQFLAPAEAIILAQSSLLQDAFNLEALQSITGAKREQIRALVQLSLLHYDSRADQFTFHPLVRQYAATQLSLHPQIQSATARRHAEYYINLFHQQEKALLADNSHIYQVKRHWGNMMVAWQWSIDAERLDLLIQSAQTLVNVYQISGLYEEGIVRLQAAIDMARRHLRVDNSRPAQKTLAGLLACSLELYYYKFDQPELLEKAAIEVRAWSQQLDDVALEVMGLLGLARVVEIRGDYRAAVDYAQQALAKLQPEQEPALQVQGLLLVMGAALVLGQFEQSFQNGLEALAYLRQMPDRIREAEIDFHLGLICRRRQDYSSALHYLSTAAALGLPLQQAKIRIFEGDLLCDLGDYAQAKTTYEQALNTYQNYAAPAWESWLYTSYGRLLHHTGKQQAARSYYERVLTHHPQEYLAFSRALLYMALLLAEADAFTEAATFYQQLYSLRQQLHLDYGGSDLYAGWGALSLAQADLTRATAQIELALVELATHGITLSEEPFQVYWHCYCVLQATADQRAVPLLQEAYQLLQTQATGIAEPALRHTFLTNVAAVVRLVEARQTQMTITTDANP